MELREAIKVLDSDAHARDLDNDIKLPARALSESESGVYSE